MIGIDVVETKRFKKVNPKIFDQRELDHAFSYSDPEVHLAGFWAAKEAFLKAQGEGITTLALQEICVLHDQKGRPHLDISDEQKEKLGVLGKKIEISISHTKDIATAVCIIN